jgi:hypothetical protein
MRSKITAGGAAAAWGFEKVAAVKRGKPPWEGGKK